MPRKTSKKGHKPLSKQFDEVQAKVGTFAEYQSVAGHEENIPFEIKPAQQFLASLGAKSDPNASLSVLKDGAVVKQLGNKSIQVNSFVRDGTEVLTITGERVDRLVNSAKVYVNTDIFPQDQYAEAIAGSVIRVQDKSVNPKTGFHWQNMASEVCHTQEIDLLVELSIDSKGKALTKPRTGVIDKDAPAVLLLSTPGLNAAYGVGANLSQSQKEAFIASMYRNLFYVARGEVSRGLL